MAIDSPAPTTIPSSSIPISKKLVKANYRLWCAQMEGLLFGTKSMLARTVVVKIGDTTMEKPNSEYTSRLARDQALLGYLLSSMMRDTLMGVTMMTTSTAAWSALHKMYPLQTRARSINTRIMLANTKMGTTMMAMFYFKIKYYAHGMKNSFLMSSLDLMRNSTILWCPPLSPGVEPISPPELYSHMLNNELCIDKQSGGGYSSHSSANATSRGAQWNQRDTSSPRHDNSRGSPSATSRGGFSSPNNTLRRNLSTDLARG
jgi:hypothetical protein